MDGQPPSSGAGTSFDRTVSEGRPDVPLSALEHYSYCPRQCALIHVEQTFDENQFTIRGRIAHERVDSGEDSTTRGVHALRALPLWSDVYGLIGRADVVEFRHGSPFPVEYKVGRRRGVHADLQLCAQALCLEEMFGTPVTQGALYFREERRRYEVTFDGPLRARTLSVVDAVREQIARQLVPEAPDDQRCPNCSLINACLPGVVGEAGRLRADGPALFRPQPLAEEDARPPRARKSGGTDA